MKYDFSGYATKNDLKCSDGRTIMKDAFKHMDGKRVPLVWQHLHNEPANILGFALLEHKDDGVYSYGSFNDSEAGQNAKKLVDHGDITMLSIYANELQENKQTKAVMHGSIREVSLVLAGANPGALIDNLSFAHGDELTVDDTEAVVYTGLEFALPGEDITHADPPGEKTVQEVFDSMTDEQKDVVYALVAQAATAPPEDLAQSDGKKDEATLEHKNEEGDTIMKHNAFSDKEDQVTPNRVTLTKDQVKEIYADAIKFGSLKESVMQHAVTYGIEYIDYLFPDAKTLTSSPEFVSRRMEWVDKVISGAKHSPFSRIKSMSADITLETARAKGYVKGTAKKDEFFALSKRVTTPCTIYKKQKLDRDDIIDIVDMDVVAWMKAEMRIMLDEEIARAVLFSDGRDPASEDKINETNIRPIAKEDNFYAHKILIPANTSGATFIEEVVRARPNYKGSGNPTFFTNENIVADLLLVKDKIGRRYHQTEADVAAAIRVSSLVPVEAMVGIVDENGASLVGIMVNMKDYSLGADKGGAVSMFDDFDIDYNQYKYLIETRCSGALTLPKSALVFWRATGTLATPTPATFVQGTNTITIPTSTGVTYYIDGVVHAAGTHVITEDASVEAVADSTYYFAPNQTIEWTFTFVQ